MSRCRRLRNGCCTADWRANAGRGAEIRELMIVSMVNGESSRQHAKPEWLSDIEIGRHVCAILDAPANFPGPILQLKSREQVGHAE
jgi:hypothetical protein